MYCIVMMYQQGYFMHMCAVFTADAVVVLYGILFLFFLHSIKLYTTFWSLSLYDLHVPVSRYDDEIGKLEQSIKALDDNTDMVSG